MIRIVRINAESACRHVDFIFSTVGSDSGRARSCSKDNMVTTRGACFHGNYMLLGSGNQVDGTVEIEATGSLS